MTKHASQLLPDQQNFLEQVEHQAEMFGAAVLCDWLSEETRAELRAAINRIEDRVRREIVAIAENNAKRREAA